MKVFLSAAVTSDGYMDDLSSERLILSDEADWDDVYALRAKCDAILVGAETIRRDNPSLVIRNSSIREERAKAGLSAELTKVTLSVSGDIDTRSRFFTEHPEARKIVLLHTNTPKERVDNLKEVAEVIQMQDINADSIIDILSSLGLSTLMVEGGANVLKMFFEANAFNQFRLAITPFSLAEADLKRPENKENKVEICVEKTPEDICNKSIRTEAPRLPYFDNLPFEHKADRTYRRVGGMMVTEYSFGGALSDSDQQHLTRAVELSRQCSECSTAYSVGCVIVTATGDVFEGYTHETDRHNHAEEEAIIKALAVGANLKDATIYTSMEPCSTRASKEISCSEWIIRYGMKRVIYAYAEPDCFVNCNSTRLLQEAGVEVVVPADMSSEVVKINSHIIN